MNPSLFKSNLSINNAVSLYVIKTSCLSNIFLNYTKILNNLDKYNNYTSSLLIFPSPLTSRYSNVSFKEILGLVNICCRKDSQVNSLSKTYLHTFAI